MVRSNISKLVCYEGNTSKVNKFDVEEEDAVKDKECLRISSRDGHVEGKNSVLRHNVGWRSLLAVDEFRGTLRQWLNYYETRDIFCHLQKDVLGENRPCENLRRIIEGMLFAVCTMHIRGEVHGCLKHPENYAIEPVSGFPGCGGPHFVRVTLLNVHGDFSGNKNSDLSGKELEKKIDKDIQDLCYLIFNTILDINVGELPEDLKHLHKIMSSPRTPTDLFVLPRTELYAHPGVWAWNKRIVYYIDAWDAYCRLEKDEKKRVRNELDEMSGVEGWGTEISEDLTLLNVYKRKGVSYNNDGPSLIRFGRAVTLHAKKKGLKGLEIEKIIRDKFPLLMVESHFVFANNKELL